MVNVEAGIFSFWTRSCSQLTGCREAHLSREKADLHAVMKVPV